MRYSYLTAALVASGLLMSAPAFAQSTSTAPKSDKQTTAQVKKQHTDGADVTGNSNFPAASGSYAKKQQTDGEDVTGNRNFPAASK